MNERIDPPCDNWQDSFDIWWKTHAEEFKGCVSCEIRTKELVETFALALAYSVYQGDSNLFMNDFGLNYNHALCYLHQHANSDVYKHEVEMAYINFIEERYE